MLNPQRSLKEGYEVSDVNIRVVFLSLSGVGFLVFLGVMGGLIVLRSLEARPAMNPAEASPLATNATDRVFLGPMVQGDPLVDRVRILQEADSRLHSYGVIDETEGLERAHIPIEAAMAKVATGEAPYRQPVTVALEAGIQEPPTNNDATPEQSGAAGE